MKLLYTLLPVYILAFQFAYGQSISPLEQFIQEQSFAKARAYDLFEIKDVKKNGRLLKHLSYYEELLVDSSLHSQILRDKPGQLKLKVSFRGQEHILLLGKNHPLGDQYVLNDQNRKKCSSIKDKAVFYKGIIEGESRTIASASFFEDELRLCFSDDKTNYRVSRLDDGTYVIHQDRDVIGSPGFDCKIKEGIKEKIAEEETNRSSSSSSSCQYVEIFFECDYTFYLYEGSSVSSVEQQVLALFNEVQTIYFNEYIPLAISEIMVWTSSDPYQEYDESDDVLEAFRSYRGDNFDGDLAHWLSPRSVGGGRAWVGGLCSSNKHYAISGSISTGTVIPFPNYSWSVMVVAHELGHNFGSKHTHNCDWDGGQIDDCGNVHLITNNEDDDDDGEIDNIEEAEGAGCFDSGNPIYPSGGGTIMSYCHLADAGINFSAGFGPQPGDRIRSEFATSFCFSSCYTWVDYNAFSPSENGSYIFPWNSLSEGVNTVPDGGTIFIKASTGDEEIIIDTNKSFIIRTWEGSSVVGQ